MTKTRTMLAISFAAIFAISMVMAPVYAGGHLAIDSAKMTIKQKKGEIKDLKIKVGAKIPKDESGLFGWALLGWEKTLVVVTHVPAFDDSDFDDKKGAFHPHVLSLIGDEDGCESGLKIDLDKPITDPGYKTKVGKKDIKVKKVPLADLGDKVDDAVLTGFFITPEDGNLCINPAGGFVTPDVKLKK